ncbi:cation diffusion facilitator family transporter [Saccharopolyspora sp. NPDC003752]
MDSAPHHGHGHGHRSAWAGLKHAVTPHSHDAADVVDEPLAASRKGMRALWISFAALLVTAIGQAVLVALTGSVALLGDTLHNFADALTAVPIAVAFLLARRAATRRFTYGLGRAEDLAGLVVLAVIAASAALAGWEAIRRMVDPQQVEHLGWLAAAGLLGFAGNELVARYRIRVGREIGSAALVADGLHARTDGFTSLAVLGSAGGAALGWRWADPAIGLLITAAIAAVLWGSAKEVLGRVLDAVDPELVGRAELALAGAPGVRAVGGLRMRWIGHELHAEAELDVAPELSLADAHRVAHDAEHRLRHALPRLGGATIHAHPAGADHELVAHHH